MEEGTEIDVQKHSVIEVDAEAEAGANVGADAGAEGADVYQQTQEIVRNRPWYREYWKVIAIVCGTLLLAGLIAVIVLSFPKWNKRKRKTKSIVLLHAMASQ